MSSTGTAMIEMRNTSREELERLFCERLTDDCLRVAVGSHFDARLLWAQRDEAFGFLASRGLPIPMVDGATLKVWQ